MSATKYSALCLERLTYQVDPRNGHALEVTRLRDQL